MGNVNAKINNSFSINKQNKKLIKDKVTILNALNKDEIICYIMNHNRIYIGKSKYNIYNNEDNIVNILLINNVPLWYHIGGEEIQISLNEISNILLMDDDEIKDSKNYVNSAPLFTKNILQY